MRHNLKKTVAVSRCAHFALAVSIVASLAVSAIGPMAESVGLKGAWLFLWPPALLAIRCAAFYILPVVALLLLYLAKRHRASRGADTILAGANVAGCVLLILVIVGIERWSRNEAKNRFNAEFGKVKIETVFASTVVGRQLPQRTLQTTDGADVKIQNEIQNGKLTGVVFWAGYDQAWAGDIAAIKSMLEQFSSRGFRAIAINEEESPEAVRSFVRREDLHFPVLMDPQGGFFKECGLWGSIEQILLVDTNGVVVEHLKDGDFNRTLPAAVSKRLPMRN